MRLALLAVLLGAALTALSLLHGWLAIDSIFRGYPMSFVNVIPGASYSNSAGEGRDIWSFIGYKPLVVDFLVWTAVACVPLSALKLSKTKRHD
jgi:hypothetical protein